ncbi:hypothetical protein BgiBS90_022820 [Biomphalaria glabrata]|nr:hypothetical protein BgiBS90_022820 [Biomphalaria glabrata]
MDVSDIKHIEYVDTEYRTSAMNYKNVRTAATHPKKKSTLVQHLEQTTVLDSVADGICQSTWHTSSGQQLAAKRPLVVLFYKPQPPSALVKIKNSTT